MPSISDSVLRNIVRPVSATAPTAASGMALAGSSVIQPATGLPVRGAFPTSTMLGTDQYLATQGLRGRTTVAQPVVSQSQTLPKPSTGASSQVLKNKNLLATRIGGGSKLSRYNSVTVSLTPTAVGGNTTVTQVFSVGGVQPTDKVAGFQWNTQQLNAVVVLAIRVKGSGQISVDLSNPTSGSLTPTGGSITLFLVQ
jgi:hypothetical protein